MRIDFYPKLRLSFVFWDLNFISLFVNRTSIGQILPGDDLIALPTYLKPIIYSVEVCYESNIIILLMFAWLDTSEPPIIWHLHPFVLIKYSIECYLFPFQFFPLNYSVILSADIVYFYFLSTGRSSLAGEGVSVTKRHVACYHSIYLAM